MPDAVPLPVDPSPGVLVVPVRTTRTAADVGEKFPAASCWAAVSATVPPRRVEPSVVQDHRPDARTSVRHTGAWSA